jgi:hypothetical protein
MKKHCFSLVAFLFSIPLLIAMDQAPIELGLGKVNSTVFVTEYIAAVGSDCGCFLIFDPARPTERREIIHSTPTLNLFTDKKNRLGVLCADSFAVYDVTTQKKIKKIWSQTVYGKDCYAAFSHIDDTIFLYRQGDLVSDKGFTLALAHTGDNNHFNFACHPKKPEFAYPCSNESFIVKPLNISGQSKQYFAKIEKNDTLRRIIYSPDGSRILLHTDQYKLYSYDLSARKTTPISNPNNTCYNAYHFPMFLPDTNDTIAFVCKEHYVHYCDLKNNAEIIHIQSRIGDPIFNNDNFLTNLLDISPQKARVITGLDILDVKKNPIGSIRPLIRKCWLLQQYFHQSNTTFPLDIMKLVFSLLRKTFSND